MNALTRVTTSWIQKLPTGLRVLQALSAALAGVFLITAVGNAASPDTRVKIRINTAGLINESGLFLSYDKGYFSEAGLQVEFVMGAAGNSSMDILTLLATGGLDLGTSGITAALFNALNRGIGVTGLLPLNVVAKGDRSTGIVVRQDLIDSGRYREPKDLKGMKISALTLGGSGHYAVLKAVELGGLRPADIDFMTLPFPDAVVALGNKALDAAHEAEPFITAAKARGIATLAIPADQLALGLPSIALFANVMFADKNQEAVKRFVTALLRGQRDFRAAITSGTGREDLFRSLQAHTAIKDRSQLEGLNFALPDPNGDFDVEALDGLQRFFIASGAQQKLFDSGKLFDAPYLAAALAELGRVH